MTPQKSSTLSWSFQSSSRRPKPMRHLLQLILIGVLGTLTLISPQAKSAFSIPNLHKRNYQENLGDRYARYENVVYQRGWHRGAYFTQYKSFIPGWVRLFSLNENEQLLGGIELSENLSSSVRLPQYASTSNGSDLPKTAFIVMSQGGLYRVIPDQIDSLHPRPAQRIKIDWYSEMGLKVRQEFSQLPDFQSLTISPFCQSIIAD